MMVGMAKGKHTCACENGHPNEAAAVFDRARAAALTFSFDQIHDDLSRPWDRIFFFFFPTALYHPMIIIICRNSKLPAKFNVNSLQVLITII
jgi:hypothetical protein